MSYSSSLSHLLLPFPRFYLLVFNIFCISVHEEILMAQR